MKHMDYTKIGIAYFGDRPYSILRTAFDYITETSILTVASVSQSSINIEIFHFNTDYEGDIRSALENTADILEGELEFYIPDGDAKRIEGD